MDELSMASNHLDKFLNILASCQVNAISGCFLYTGSVSPSQKYPKVKITTLHSPYSMNMHVFIYKMSHNIQPQHRFPPNQDVSHLCHQPTCMQIGHLNLESRQINNHRKLCKTNGTCFGHFNQPDCKFSKFPIIYDVFSVI
jgi:hypothetical protein